MKRSLSRLSISTLLLLTSGLVKAQLKNTSWQGKLMVPEETAVIFQFKTDSANLIIADNGMVGESMTYSVRDSLITMKKTDGNSPCTIGDEFKLIFKIRGDQLFLKNLSDPCDDRTHAWTNQPLLRVK